LNAPSPSTPHPLAQQLVELHEALRFAGPILEIGAGSGRNSRFLRARGLEVIATSDDDLYTQLPGGRHAYAAALSTHGYLHGTTAKLRVGFAELQRVLKPGAPLFLTLGSINDARYGFGEPADDDEHTFAPGDGPEKGIPHAYFDHDSVLALLTPGFTVTTLEEVDVSEIVGRWAHGDEPTTGMRHWFVEARRR
jgi:hypothetical protein